MRITADMLRKAKACEPDIAKFEERWPDGCAVTKRNCRIAFCELDMSPDWAGEYLLPEKARAEYWKTAALDEYKKAKADAFWRAATQGGI